MSETAQDLAEYRYDKVIDLTQERFTKMAPKSIDFDKEKGFAIQLLQSKPELMQAAIECPHSLQQAVTNIAGIGLSLNPAKKEAYLITRNVKVQKNPDQWETRIMLEPSYIGLCNLATNTGSVLWVQAKHVRDGDTYTNNGVDKAPTHEYNTFKDRGDIIGYYCVAKTHNGDYLTTEMSIDEINKVRDSSDSFKKGFGPWKDWPDEQAKKTVIRRAFKTWPKTDQFNRIEEAVHLSNENEGMEQYFTSPTMQSYSAQQKEHFDYLISQNNAIDMFLFMYSLREQEGVINGLYNSFEKGKKGEYKKIVTSLESRGASQLQDCITAVNDAAQASDEHGIIEVISDLSEDAIAHIKDHCSPEAAQMIREMEQ